MAANPSQMQSHLAAIANAMPDPIFVMSESGVYLDVIGGKERRLYADAHPLIGKNYRDVLPEKMAERFTKVVKKAIASGQLQEIEYQLADTQVSGIEPNAPHADQWYEARVYPLDSDAYQTPAAIWLAINITQRKHMEEQIEQLSSKDPLTGLYNRDFFLELINEELKKAKMNQKPMALAKINLDCFKRITDGYGHEVGDKAMLTAARSIEQVVGELGYLGRLSCDQFMVLLPDVKGVDAFRITKLAQETLSAQTIPLYEQEQTCLTSHAGITELRAPNEDAQALVHRVNQAIQKLEGTREITRLL
mgnify:CR=1 FL=1